MSKLRQILNRLPNDLVFPRISAGVSHCLAIIEVDENHREKQAKEPQEGDDETARFLLMGWGSNEFGCLGAKFRVEDNFSQSGEEDEDDGDKSGSQAGMDEAEEAIKSEPVRIKLRFDSNEYVPIQVACGAKHSLVIGLPVGEYNKLAKDKEKNKIDLDKVLSNPKWTASQAIFSCGVPLNGRLGRIGHEDDQAQPSLEISEMEGNDSEDGEEDQDTTDKFFMRKTVEGLSGIIMICCGANFSMALDEHGFVFTWGEGSTGALGNGKLMDQPKPTRIEFDPDTSLPVVRIKFIAAGTSHAAALSETGKLYTWGLGNYGQLGHGNNKSLSAPAEVEKLAQKSVEHVSCGGMHTCCVTSDGYAHSFGLNKNGQLGTQDFEDRNEPTKIQKVSNYFVMYSKCGGNTTFLVTEERFIFSFGCNLYGRLALKDSHLPNQPTPTQVDSKYFQNKNEFVYQMGLSYHFGLALTQKGNLITWGLPFKGCLARDLQSENLENQGQVIKQLDRLDDDLDLDDEKISKLKFEQADQDAIKQLTRPQIAPIISKEVGTLVKMNSDKLIKKLSKEIRASQYIELVKCGSYHSVALTDVGEIWVWGSNQSRQHGMSDKDCEAQHRKRIKYCYKKLCQHKFPYSRLSKTEEYQQIVSKITYLATGYEYIVAVENRRSIYSWGKNNQGQLGLGFVSEYVEQPSKLTDIEGMLIKMVACGEDHTLILNDEGQVFAFGSQADGKLGLGQKQTLQLNASKIEHLRHVTSICCGPHHSMALAADPLQGERVIPLNFKNQDDNKDGKNKDQHDAAEHHEESKYVIYSWGNGWGGKLGHGNFENQFSPKLIQTKYTSKAISCGTNHSAAITAEDNIIVWGVGVYLGFTRPDEEIEQDHQKSRSRRKNHHAEVEPHFIRFPTLHPDLQKWGPKYTEICLGDKYNVAVTTQRRIIEWGLFNSDFQQKLLRKTYESEAKRQQEIEFLLVNVKPNDPNSEIQFSNVSCSFNHAAAMTQLGSEQSGTQKKECFTWGIDGMTGRLGLGYEFTDAEKEEEIKLTADNGENLITKKPNEVKDLGKPQENPKALSFINQYLDCKYQKFDAKQRKGDENQDMGNVDMMTLQIEKPKTAQKKGIKTESQRISKMQNTSMDTKQIVNSKKRKPKQSESSQQIIKNLGLQIPPGLPVYKMSQDQYLKVCKPDVYVNCTKVKLFDEKKINDIYEKAITLEQQNQKLYAEYKKGALVNFRHFKNEATLTILKKIQRDPFKIQFKTPEHHGFESQFMENKFAYKILLSLLQLHPCYLLNIYKNNLMTNDDEFIEVVFDVFGDMQNDRRKYRLFQSLALDILKHDLKIKDYKVRKFSLEKSDEATQQSYVFTRLFVGFANQFHINIAFNIKICELAERIIHQQIYQSNSVQKPLRDYALAYTEQKMIAYITKRILDPSMIKKHFDSQQEIIVKLMQNFLSEINQFLQPFAAPPKPSAMLGNQTSSLKLNFAFAKPVQELIFETSEILKTHYAALNLSEDNIQNKVLNLCFFGYIQLLNQRNRQSKPVKQDLDQEGGDVVEDRSLNIQCHIELFTAYLKQEPLTFDKTTSVTDQTQVAFINETFILEPNTKYRSAWFQKLQGKPNHKTLVKKYKDIYDYALKYKDECIYPRIKTLVSLTKVVLQHANHIIPGKSANDMLLIFEKQLSKEDNYLTKEADPKTLDTRVHIRLNSRQLYYTKNTFSIKKCRFCSSYLLDTFLAAEDKPFLERFDHWNPASLASLFINVVECFSNKKEYDEFISGGQSNVAQIFHAKCAENKKANMFENIIKIKNFEKAFTENVTFYLDQDDNIQPDQIDQARFAENKKQLKNLKKIVEGKLVDIYIYIYDMLHKITVLDQINFELDQQIRHHHKDQPGQYARILSNCFFGLSNKEVEKPLEHNMSAMVSKIRNAINSIPTSPEIYENIDIFRPAASASVQNVRLGMFGSFSHSFLKRRQILESLESKLVKKVKRIIKTQTISDQEIFNNLLFTFQHHERDILVYLIYQESKVNIKTICTCGLWQPARPPIELILEKFHIPNTEILDLRKRLILSKSIEGHKTQKFGRYAHFNSAKLLEMFDELQNHYVIYDHL